MFRSTVLFILIPILLLVFWLGAHGLNADLIWIDEMYSIDNIGGLQKTPFNPLQVIESILIQSPQHTPGYFILLSGWAALVGWEPAALRALALFAGMLAVAWTYRLGRDVASPQAGLYGALLTSGSAFFAYYNHELRMYAFVALLTAFETCLYLRIIRRQKSSRLAWVGLLLGGIALIYTHYYAALPLATLGVYHLLIVPKNQRWWKVTGVFVLIGLAFLPYVPVQLGGLKNLTETRADLGRDSMNPAQLVQALGHLFSNGQPLLLVLGVFSLWAIFAKRPGARTIGLLTLVLLLVTVGSNLVTGTVILKRVRYLLAFWPLLTLLFGLGFVELQRRYRPALLLIAPLWLLIGINATFTSDAFLGFMDGPRHLATYPPLREIYAALEDQTGADDLVVGISRSADIYTLYKLNTIGEHYLTDLKGDYFFIGVDDWRSPDPAKQKQRLRELSANRLFLWFTYEPDKIAAETMAEYRAVLEEQYQFCATLVDEPHLRIERYDRAALECLPEAPTDTVIVSFQDRLALTELRVLPDENDLTLLTAWNVSDAVPLDTYSVSFKLRGADHNYVAQYDSGLRSVGAGWQQAIIPLTNVPDADYELTVTVYDWRTGERLTGTVIETGETGYILPVYELP